MRAILYQAFREPPELTTVPDPAPAPTGVVVRVAASGLCLSDWHGWQGHDPDIRVPHVPGHELAGEIVAVGNAVKLFRVGERVTVPFVGGCGACPQCAAGEQQVCDAQFQPGFTHWGSFAEYVALDHADVNLVRLPDTIDSVTAAVLGCRFITSYRAVHAQGRVEAGQWVVVHGCGGIGLSAIMIAAAAGARVLAVDINADKLTLATELGAEATLDARSVSDVPAAVRDLTGGGAHLSIDALGSPQTCFDSVAGLRKRGRHVQVGLLTGAHKHPPLPMDLVVARELEIVGSHGMQAHRYPAMFEHIQSGTLQPQLLVGRTISLADAVPALMAMDRANGAGVTVINRF
jgi:alcohol dehydrogenase